MTSGPPAIAGPFVDTYTEHDQHDANCAKGASYGSSRLFALNAKTGAIIWKSDVVAEINGDTIGSDTEIH